ncbi:MAG: hypothetical protein WCV59_00150 [Parcubacteria group bacterium]
MISSCPYHSPINSCDFENRLHSHIQKSLDFSRNEFSGFFVERHGVFSAFDRVKPYRPHLFRFRVPNRKPGITGDAMPFYMQLLQRIRRPDANVAREIIIAGAAYCHIPRRCHIAIFVHQKSLRAADANSQKRRIGDGVGRIDKNG